MISKKKKKISFTKTYRYLFDIWINSELKYYCKKLYEEINKINNPKYINAYVDDNSVGNKYWLRDETDDKNYAYIYVLIDNKVSGFKNIIKELHNCRFYTTHYIYSKDTSKTVIVFCTTDDFFINAYEFLLQSTYSKMYYNKNYKLSATKEDPYAFLENNKNSLINYHPQQRNFKDSYYVLTKNIEYFNVEILPLLGEDPSPENIEAAKEGEFDGRFIITEETL